MKKGSLTRAILGLLGMLVTTVMLGTLAHKTFTNPRELSIDSNGALILVLILSVSFLAVLAAFLSEWSYIIGEPERMNTAAKRTRRDQVLKSLKRHLGNKDAVAVLALHVEQLEMPEFVLLEREIACELLRRGVRTALIDNRDIRDDVLRLPSRTDVSLIEARAEIDRVTDYARDYRIKYILYSYRDWLHDSNPNWILYGLQQKSDVLEQDVKLDMDMGKLPVQIVDSILDAVALTPPMIGKVSPTLEPDEKTAE